MKSFAIVLVALSLVAVAPVSHAGDAAELSARDQQVRWRGAFENVSVPSPEACVTGLCGTFVLDVRLPRTTGPQSRALLVAIDRKPAVVDNLYNLDLYVYGPDGELAASSTNGLYMPSEAALVAAPANGRYEVVVVPRAVVGRVTYLGFASIERSRLQGPRRDLLPNLVARRPTNIRLQTGVSATPFVTFDRGVRGPTSCYPPEVTEGHSRCLRFDQSVANVGEGPLELRYRDEADGRMRQRIYRTDGSFRDRVAGKIEFHAVHAHFHYAGFMQSFLFRARDDGSKGMLVRKANKQGFCMVDVHNLRFGRRGGSPHRYDFPGACDGMAQDEHGYFTWAGISPGWADVYPWNLADQYIDVAGVPDGRYVLELRANVDGFLSETNRRDNTASVLVRLREDSVQPLS